MVKKKQKQSNAVIPSVVFVFSTIILFVNNLTMFFENYGINTDINIITWFGIGLSLIWWMFLFGKKNKMW